MYANSLVAVTLMAVALATPTKRGGTEVQDQSGNAQVYFECDSSTYPVPGGSGGAGEGGVGISKTSLEVHFSDGTVLNPSEGDCVQDSALGVASQLQYCTMHSDKFDAGYLAVHVHYTDIGGDCSLSFNYKSEQYDASSVDGCSSKCGYDDGGFEPFHSSLSTVCYFNQ